MSIIANYSVGNICVREIALWHISHIENIESILHYGLMSRNNCLSKRLLRRDISYFHIQNRRLEYHDYVPLYLADNTPMLHNVIHRYGEKIVLLQIDISMLRSIHRYKCTNGNLASSGTKVYNRIEELVSENKDVLKIVYSDGPCYSREYKRARACEVLIPHCVKKQFIQTVYVQTERILIEVAQVKERYGLRFEIRQELTDKGVRYINFWG